MIEVLNIPPGDIFKACPELQDIRCFVDFYKMPEGLPVRETICYVVLLYTKDSFLNKKPVEPLGIRRVKAAKLAGLDHEDELIERLVFGMESEALDSLVIEYLIHQSSYAWSDRCAIEAQMDENLRIRFKSIESDKGDKDVIEASTKKFLLSEHFAKYHETLKKRDLEIFLGHDEVRDSAVRKSRKTSLESLVK